MPPKIAAVDAWGGGEENFTNPLLEDTQAGEVSLFDEAQHEGFSEVVGSPENMEAMAVQSSMDIIAFGPPTPSPVYPPPGRAIRNPGFRGSLSPTKKTSGSSKASGSTNSSGKASTKTRGTSKSGLSPSLGASGKSAFSSSDLQTWFDTTALFQLILFMGQHTNQTQGRQTSMSPRYTRLSTFHPLLPSRRRHPRPRPRQAKACERR